MTAHSRNQIAAQEIQRLEAMVQKRAAKLADAKRKLKAAKDRAK